MGPSRNGGSASQGSGSTTVQRRDLVETDTESGTLSYADPRTVYDGLSGTITWLPAVGQVIKPGVEFFDRDVILMGDRRPFRAGVTFLNEAFRRPSRFVGQHASD